MTISAKLGLTLRVVQLIVRALAGMSVQLRLLVSMAEFNQVVVMAAVGVCRLVH
jgi:hypothetical protein